LLQTAVTKCLVYIAQSQHKFRYVLDQLLKTLLWI